MAQSGDSSVRTGSGKWCVRQITPTVSDSDSHDSDYVSNQGTGEDSRWGIGRDRRKKEADTENQDCPSRVRRNPTSVGTLHSLSALCLGLPEWSASAID